MPVISGGSGGAGGLTALFASTLGAPAANIDTGAGGIAGGHGDLVIYIVTRTADAAAAANVQITLNADTGANYDAQFVTGSNVTAAAAPSLAQTNWQIETHGNGGTAGYAGIIDLIIPAYDATTFNKAGSLRASTVDGTAANNQVFIGAVGWRNTAAITRLTVTGATANLQAGSRLVIYGTR